MTAHSLPTVLAIAELFENILAQLPLSDLLNLQLVSRHWRNVINDSPKLQEKLFFQPTPQHTLELQEPQLNSLLKSLFPLFFPQTPFPDPDPSNANSDVLAQPWFQEDFPESDDIKELDWFKDDGRRKAVLRPEASWRRMFLTQPPTRISDFMMSSFCCTNDSINYPGKIRSSFEHRQQQGATMGLVYDILVLILDSFSDGKFFIEWHRFPALPKRKPSETVDESVSESKNDLGDEAGEEMENNISIFIWNNADCMPRKPVPTGLEVDKCDPELIDWEDNDIPSGWS